MPENNLIKSIVILPCPHCKLDIYVESQMTPPVVNSLFSTKDLEEAKKDCLARIETLTLEDNRKQSVIKWINDPATIFGPSEVENIILSLLSPEE
jgi:hypothetical protein